MVPAAFSRRDMLRYCGAGFGTLGLAGVLAADTAAAPAAGSLLSPRASHFPARAKRVIFLFMNGGPSHVDTFDPKPALETNDGKDPPSTVARAKGKLMKSPFTFRKYGSSGMDVSELFPEVAKCADD